MDDLEARYKKTKCFWCQSPSTLSRTPCCVGAMMWQAAVVNDARRWLAENNPEQFQSEFGDDDVE